MNYTFQFLSVVTKENNIVQWIRGANERRCAV